MTPIRARWPLALVGLCALAAAACQPAPAPAPDYAAMRQPIVDAVLDGWNNGNLDGLDAVLSADVKRRSPRGMSDAENLAEFKEVMSGLRAAYPDARVTVDEAHYLEDAGFVLWTFTGTHTGVDEIPATGRSVSVSGITALRFADGMLAEEHVVYDMSDWLMQLGYTMVPPAAEGTAGK